MFASIDAATQILANPRIHHYLIEADHYESTRKDDSDNEVKEVAQHLKDLTVIVKVFSYVEDGSLAYSKSFERGPVLNLNGYIFGRKNLSESSFAR